MLISARFCYQYHTLRRYILIFHDRVYFRLIIAYSRHIFRRIFASDYVWRCVSFRARFLFLIWCSSKRLKQAPAVPGLRAPTKPINYLALLARRASQYYGVRYFSSHRKISAANTRLHWSVNSYFTHHHSIPFTIRKIEPLGSTRQLTHHYWPPPHRRCAPAKWHAAIITAPIFWFIRL
jgi:hypothetical protein